MAGIYDSQMQRIHDIAKALDEAGQLEQRQRGGNMEQIFASEANPTDLVYRKEDVDAALAELREQVQVGEQLTGSFFEALKPLNLQAIYVQNPGIHITELITQLTAATTRAEQAELLVRNMQSDCAEHNQDLVRAVMKWKQAEAIIQDALIEGGAIEGESILHVVKNLKRIVEALEAQLNDPIYQECCANLKKPEVRGGKVRTSA